MPDIPLERSGRIQTCRTRKLLEAWLARYPEEHRAELKTRLGQENGRSAAFFEIYLHELLTRLGYDLVAVHPIAPGSDKRPEFLFRDRDGQELYLEATEVKGPEEDSKAAERERELHEAIERADIEDWHVSSIDWMEAPDKGLSSKRCKQIAKALKKWADSQPQGEPKAPVFLSLDQLLGNSTFQHPGWDLEFQLSQKSTISGIGKGYWLGAQGSICNALKRKARRYGELDRPYVIAINVLTERHAGLNEVVEALHQLKYSRVSAVLYVASLYPYSIADQDLVLLHNPAANKSTPGPLKELRSWTAERGLSSGKHPREILGLYSGWPGDKLV